MLPRILILILGLTSPLLAADNSGFSAPRLDRTRVAIQAMIARHEYAGVNALIFRHEHIVWQDTSGYLDVEAGKPMQPDTIFAIASMSKPVTAVAVMMLYEEGKFLLEDPVAKYLPDFGKMTALTPGDEDQTHPVPVASPMTIRQLLTHTSGLFNFKGYKAAGINLQLNLEAVIDRIATVPLSHQPGQEWHYGVSYDVLARLVEVWSGQSFDAFLQQRIFDPLKMSDTAFFVPMKKAGRLARKYKLNSDGIVEALSKQGAPEHMPVYLSGSGGLYSTTGDFLCFCRMLLNGGELDGQRLLSPATVAYMFMNHVPKGVLPPDGPNGRKGFGMGLGGYVLLDPPAYEDLSIEGEFNGAGVGGTFFWIDRKNDLIGLWFSQRYPQVQTTLKRFKVLTYQALVK